LSTIKVLFQLLVVLLRFIWYALSSTFQLFVIICKGLWNVSEDLYPTKIGKFSLTPKIRTIRQSYNTPSKQEVYKQPEVHKQTVAERQAIWDRLEKEDAQNRRLKEVSKNEELKELSEIQDDISEKLHMAWVPVKPMRQIKNEKD
jgi:hypothetical protein